MHGRESTTPNPRQEGFASPLTCGQYRSHQGKCRVPNWGYYGTMPSLKKGGGSSSPRRFSMSRTSARPVRRSQPLGPTPASRAADTARLFKTKNDLPHDTRVQVVELLGQRLADCIDLQSQCK